MTSSTVSRPWRWAFRLLAATAVSIAVDAAAAEGVAIRSAPHDGFGRIVFDWAEPTNFETSRFGDELRITFSRPLAGDLAGPLAGLPQYLAGAAVEPDGRTVVLTLKGAIGYRAFPEAKLVVVDLLAAADSADRTAQVKDAEASALPALPVRVGTHGEFDRIVFDWPQSVSYTIERAGDRLAIRFDRAARLDLSTLSAKLPRWIKPAAVRRGANDLTVELIVPPETRFRDFVNGRSVVLDLFRSATVPSESPPAEPAATPAPTMAAAAGDESGAESGVAAPAPAGKSEDDAQTAASSMPPPITPVESSEAADAALAALAVPAQPGTVALGLQPTADGLDLRFDWDLPTAAAAFRRGDALWVVFDREHPLVLPDLGAPILRQYGLEGGTLLEGAPATAIRFLLAPGFEAGMRRDGDDWVVGIAAEPRSPERLLAVKVEPDASDGGRVFVPETDAGPVIALTDPDAGDTLLVVPLSRSGRGVAPARSYAEFALLASVQGVAIHPLSDALRVQGLRDGIAITSASGLELSPLTPHSLASVATPVAEGQVLDIDAWRAASAAEREETKHRLLRALALADDSFRNEARFNLAAFDVANDLFADALGVLEAIERDDPDAVDTAKFRALRGIALVQLERFEAAENDLLLPLFDQYADVRLWRALAAAGRRDWPRAARLFREADVAFFDLPQDWRGPIELAAARVDVEMGDPARAGFRLQQAAKAGYPPALQGRFDYLRGRVEALLDNPDAAFAAWDSVIATDLGKARAEASLARTELLLARGELTTDQAVEALEMLRFAWRGDAFEQDLLYKLGEFYVARGQYMKGLAAWRTAAEQFPKEPMSETIETKMTEVFVQVYEQAKAGRISALDAVGIFFEFRELTPKGMEGDAIIGALADRLVQMDLLPRAAALLEAQVEQRLVGLEKARVGARLAVIQLLDGNPAGALRALEMSALPGMRLPGELVTERRTLEARALFGVGRNAEALERLAGDSREEALLLAADIRWRSEDWRGVADTLRPLYAPERAEQPLDDSGRYYLVKCALALALAGDRGDLDRLSASYGKALDGTAYADTFRAVTTEALPGELPFRDFVKAVANVDSLQAALNSYRERIETAGLSGIN